MAFALSDAAHEVRLSAPQDVSKDKESENRDPVALVLGPTWRRQSASLMSGCHAEFASRPDKHSRLRTAVGSDLHVFDISSSLVCCSGDHNGEFEAT